MLKTKWIPLLLLAIALTSCDTWVIFGDDPTPEPEPLHEARTLVFSPTDTSIHQCQTAYSLRLLQEIAKEEEGNMMISPVSAEMVLAMLMNGAEGETQDEIRTALSMGQYTPEQINAYHQKLVTALPYLDTQTKIKISNALWVRPAMSIKNPFLQTLRESYAAQVDSLDLSNPASADVINHWADTSTNHLIKEVMDKSEMNNELRMVIANALYFKGSWEDKFIKELTKEEDFTLADGSTKKAPIMWKQDDMLMAPKSKGIEASFLRLFYKENKYCMDIILPEGQQTAQGILGALTTERLDSLSAAARTHKVELKLPRFESEYNRMLNPDMQALGIKRIFSSNAQLGAITEAESLYLSILKQMTYIKVDEEGTEAAAVTIGKVGITSVQEPEMPIPFYATRPFIYFIRDVEHGTILFAGIYAKP